MKIFLLYFIAEKFSLVFLPNTCWLQNEESMYAWPTTKSREIQVFFIVVFYSLKSQHVISVRKINHIFFCAQTPKGTFVFNEQKQLKLLELCSHGSNTDFNWCFKWRQLVETKFSFFSLFLRKSFHERMRAFFSCVRARESEEIERKARKREIFKREKFCIDESMW